MKVALCQLKVTDDLEQNHEQIVKVLKQTKADLYLFPELSLTGYQETLKELVNSSLFKEILENLINLSLQKTFILGVPVFREGKLYNSALLFKDGSYVVVAEKTSLFPGFDDRASFRIGEIRKCFELGGHTLAIFICFELRATELVREFALQGVTTLIFLAQWPKVRIKHWEILLQARAIENQVYVLGVNAVGQALGVELGGQSLGFSYDGSKLSPEMKEQALIGSDTLIFNIEPWHLNLPYPRKVVFPEIPKVFTLDELLPIIERRRLHGEKIVFTNGCFDILHAGHVDYLEKARTLGDLLVVGLNSDPSIRRIKGQNRPINPQHLRAKVLAGLACVDYIVLFEEDTPEELIRRIRPHVLVKGADWEEDKIVGASFVKSYGGKVARIPFSYDISTTKMIKRIKELKKT